MQRQTEGRVSEAKKHAVLSLRSNAVQHVLCVLQMSSAGGTSYTS